MRSIAIVLALLILFIACGKSGPSFSEAEFPIRTITVDGVNYNYRVYLPKDRIKGQHLPVMLYLHGSNRRGSDNQSQLADLYENIRGFPQNFPFIIVFPQCREKTFWAGPMMD